MKDWLQQGVAAAILFALGCWWWKAGWPFIKKSIEQSREDRHHDQGVFIKALEHRDQIMEKGFKDLQVEISKLAGKRERPR